MTVKQVWFNYMGSDFPAFVYGQHASGAVTLGFAPYGTVAMGQLILAWFVFNGGTGVTVVPPAGFTLVAGSRYDHGTDYGIACYQKTRTGAEPADYTFTATGGDHVGLALSIFAGQNVGAEFDRVAYSVESADGPTYLDGSINNDWPGLLVVPFVVVGGVSDAWTWAPPDTELQAGYEPGGNWSADWVAARVVTDLTARAATAPASTPAGSGVMGWLSFRNNARVVETVEELLMEGTETVTLEMA